MRTCRIQAQLWIFERSNFDGMSKGLDVSDRQNALFRQDLVGWHSCGDVQILFGDIQNDDGLGRFPFREAVSEQTDGKPLHGCLI